MTVEVNGNNVEFDEIGQTLDVLDCYDAEVEVLGTDNNDVEYSAVGIVSCGELVEIDEDSIEVVDTELEYLEWLVDNNPDDGSWGGR